MLIENKFSSDRREVAVSIGADIISQLGDSQEIVDAIYGVVKNWEKERLISPIYSGFVFDTFIINKNKLSSL